MILVFTENDPAHNSATNLRKHGVSFDEAMTVFEDWESITSADPDHSESEERYVIIGLSSRRERRKYGR